MIATRAPALAWTGAAAASVALGIGIVANPQLAFIATVAFLGATALAAPAGAWVLCALIAALTFRGLVQLNLLPSVATFIDLPLAWGALAVALVKNRTWSPFLRRHLWWLAALGLAMLLAWAFHPSELLRPVLYLALLGEPFAIVGALVADPPSQRLRRLLKGVLLGLVLLQIPLVALQLATLGQGDTIQGTLYGAGAGAHVISGVVVVGAIWFLSGGVARRALGAMWLPVVLALFVIPFIADAKQVIVALPAILLASSWSGGRLRFLLRAVLVAGLVVVLFTLVPAGRTAEQYLERNGQNGKEATLVFVWDKLDDDPASIVFGRGPAETVSRAAFLTTPQQQRRGSPLADLGLKPSPIAADAQGAAQDASGDATSFDTGISSTIGVLGDLGIFGAAAYGGLLLSLTLRLRRETSPEGVAAAAGFALFLVLGLVFDWWEQPPFGVFIGTLAGLALTDPGRRGSTIASGDNLPPARS
jgi:hypothetical protein